MPIIDELFKAIDEKQSPIVVGLDPLVERIANIDITKHEIIDALPELKTRQDIANLFLETNIDILTAIKDFVPAVKLQMACYELYGPEGITAFEETVDHAKKLGFFVIDDSKRSDIGSTAKLYALGHLASSPYESGSRLISDFLTVNPYLGDDGLEPFFEVAMDNDKGVFVLVRTSNPSAVQYQDAIIDGMPLYEKIAVDMEARAKEQVGEYGFAPWGAVVGATRPSEAKRLREIMPHVPFLVPGYGSQGGTGKDVMPCFNNEGYGALINSSRGIMFAAERDDLKDKSFAEAAQIAAKEMREDIIWSMKRANKLPRGWS